MNGTTYNQIVIFHAIVSEGRITQAARKLGLKPPSVSQALKALEKQVGLPLFSRTTRRIELTEAGQILYDRTLKVMAELDSALENVRDLSEVPSGKVSLTLPRFAYQYWFATIYAEFCRRYPSIQLEISISDASVNIISAGFDMGIRFGDRVDEGMVARQLTPPMQEAIFVSPGYAEKFGLPDSLEALQSHRLIQYRFISSNQLAPLKLDDAGQVTTVDMPIALIVNDTDLMVDAALKGLGVGRIVTPVVADYFEHKQLIPLFPEKWYRYPGLYVYFQQNTQKAKRVRVLIDFLIEKAVQEA